MDNFTTILLYGLLLFVVFFLSGVFKAYMTKSPLSEKEELIKYHKYVAKPMFWTFIVMFAMVFGLGWLADSDLIQVAQRATIAGLYTALCVYVFMIWGANLIQK